MSNSYPTTPSILLAQRRLLIGFGSQRKLASDCTKSDFRTKLMDSSAFLPQMQHVLHLFFHSSHSDFQPKARLFPQSDHVFGSLSKQPPIIFWFGLVAHGTCPALGKTTSTGISLIPGLHPNVQDTGGRCPWDMADRSSCPSSSAKPRPEAAKKFCTKPLYRIPPWTHKKETSFENHV